MAMNAATTQFCDRPKERYWLWRAGDAFVEFSTGDECNWCCDLLNISASGICFGLIDEQPGLEPGKRIDGALLHVDDVDIDGSLVIAHITDSLSTGTLCGAQFLPVDKSAERAYAGVISRLEKADQ
jgi:hypothetical protein